LNHTSGIYNYTNHPNFFNDVLSNPEQIMLPEELLANYVLSLDFVAGTDFTYSNTNYILLGMIIEEITGQAYYEEARERFDFDTNYPSLALPPFETSTDDLAHLWADLDGFGVADIQASGTSLNNLFSGAGPAGAYVATPKDLSQWVRDLYTGEILQPSTMAELLTPSAFNENYGLGVEFISGGAIVSGIGFCSTDVVGHSGGIFYTTFTYYDEENDLSITAQTNDAVTEANMRQLVFDMFCINNSFVMSIDEELSKESLAVFPNPFIDHLVISYELSSRENVSLALMDYTGKEIIKIDQSRKSAGAHQEEFTMDLPSGLYLLKLVIDDQITYKKIIKN
jgi:D-alanyl-D-alanine carboxypeptidase